MPTVAAESNSAKELRMDILGVEDDCKTGEGWPWGMPSLLSPASSSDPRYSVMGARLVSLVDKTSHQVAIEEG